jgi:hypothetical protein
MKRVLLALLAAVLAGPARAATDPQNEWIKHYYQTQDVGHFDAFWQSVVKNQLLENKNAIAPTVGFASQVIHRHPELIKGRLDNLAAFPEKQRDAVVKLLWLSDTDQGRAILQQSGAAGLAATTPPAIGQWEIKGGGDLDLCWGWYFATGNTAALDSIISALDYAQYAGALKRYPNSEHTEADRAAAIKDAIFSAALWSLAANGREDPLIAKHIRIEFYSPATPSARKVWLGVIFAKASPNVSQHELEENQAGR